MILQKTFALLTAMKIIFCAHSASAIDMWIPESQASIAAKNQEIVDKLATIRALLKNSTASPSKNCEAPLSTTCSFSSYCAQIDDKKESFYLYNDGQGHQFPNFSALITLKTAEICLGNFNPLAINSDPFAFPEQLLNEIAAGSKANLEKNREKYQQAILRSQAIFAKTRERVLKTLEKKRTSENSTQIENMIARIKTVTLASASLENGTNGLAASGCEMPNAVYMNLRHDITVCPQLLNLPEPTLIATLAHELGHAIDPCNTSFSFSQNQNGNYHVDTPESMGGSSKPGPFEIPSIKPDNLAYNSVISCLEKPDSMGIKLPNKEDVIERLATHFPQNKNLPDFVNAHYDEFKNCLLVRGDTKIQEAFADWMSSQVIADQLSEIQDSEKAKKIAFESQLIFLGIDCPRIKKKTLETMDKAATHISEQCTQFRSLNQAISQDIQDPSHPKSEDRVNRIYFPKQEIQKALGCKGESYLNGPECKW